MSERVAAGFRRFADEARGRSELYVELAERVAQDRELLAMLAALPRPRQQPNLLLGAVKLLCGAPSGWDEFRACVDARRDEILATIMARRTQTNEPARCATLLPLLATLPPPLALLEVGASAGLCLLPDRYAYDYDGHRVEPDARVGAEPPVFRCHVNAPTPLPARCLEVAWRAGLDLDPVDVRDPDDVAWLEALVWPGEGDRLRLLRAALAVARADPPRVVAGDLRHDLGALATEAPRDATLVVFHTAVLAYVADSADRVAFADAVRSVGGTWVAQESPSVLLGEASGDPWPEGRFVLTRDGVRVAWVDPHGTAIDWI
jgi:hypothetical protein